MRKLGGNLNCERSPSGWRWDEQQEAQGSAWGREESLGCQAGSQRDLACPCSELQNSFVSRRLGLCPAAQCGVVLRAGA